MDDLISRQALCEYALNQKDKSVTPNDIMRFPSAQPEQDCILKQFGSCSYSETGCSDCAIKVKIRKALPSVQPEIIHCKDCKWYGLPSHKISENCVKWVKRNSILLPIKPDDFCSYAERREDG